MKRRASSITFALAFVVCANSACQGQARTYTNKKYGYELQVPIAWNLVDNGAGVPIIFNYKLGEGGPQGLFPTRGAEIRVIPFGLDPRTAKAGDLTKWIRNNLGAGYSNVSFRYLPDKGKSNTVPSGVMEFQADFWRNDGDDEQQHDVSYFFTMRGTMFRLMLSYWKTNPQADTLQSVCRLVLHSIEAR